MFNLSAAIARASSDEMWPQILPTVSRETYGKVCVFVIILSLVAALTFFAKRVYDGDRSPYVILNTTRTRTKTKAP